MKLDLSCSWANNGSSAFVTVDVSSYEDLEKELDDFLNDLEEDGVGVESFGVYTKRGNRIYRWDNSDLRRSEDLSDVWDKVTKHLKKAYNDYVNERKKDKKNV